MGMVKSEENSFISLWPRGKCGKNIPKNGDFTENLGILEPQKRDLEDLGSEKENDGIYGISVGIAGLELSFPMESVSKSGFELRQTNPARGNGVKVPPFGNRDFQGFKPKIPQKKEIPAPSSPNSRRCWSFPGILGRIRVGGGIPAPFPGFFWGFSAVFPGLLGLGAGGASDPGGIWDFSASLNPPAGFSGEKGQNWAEFPQSGIQGGWSCPFPKK